MHLWDINLVCIEEAFTHKVPIQCGILYERRQNTINRNSNELYYRNAYVMDLQELGSPEITLLLLAPLFLVDHEM